MKDKFKKHIVSIYSNFNQENTQIDEIEERPHKKQKKTQQNLLKVTYWVYNRTLLLQYSNVTICNIKKLHDKLKSLLMIHL